MENLVLSAHVLKLIQRTICYFFSTYYSQNLKLTMSANQPRAPIQQMEEGQKDFGIINTAKSIHKKIVTNQIVTEFDVFSVPVKLTLNGEEEYKTCCGGFLHLLVLGLCVLFTILVIFPNGIGLNSQLNVVIVPKDSGDTGQTLFDNVDEIISFRGLKMTAPSVYSYENVSSHVTLKAYQRDSNNNIVPLQISTNCRHGYDFCLKKTEQNKNAKIYGNFYSPGQFSQYITFEGIWCDSFNTPGCPFFWDYVLQMSVSNFYKKKGGQLQQYRIKNVLGFFNSVFQNNVTREQFTTNSKFKGHLVNILPFKIQSYLFNNYLSRTMVADSVLLTPGTFTGRSFFQFNIKPYGTTKQIYENFDDIGDVLLFFLSVKQTLYILLFVIFIKQYNINSGLLDIGRALFYIDDPKNKKKYDFSKGFDVFIASLFHNHPITRLIQFVMTKMGKTLQDFFPNKAYCAIKLMAKAEQVLQQNCFYGNLNELNSMQGQASKKIPLIEGEQNNQENQPIQLNYFPQLKTDSHTQKRQKQIKREAFKQFCEANEHLSPERKNFIYKVLTDNKLKYVLVDEIQKEFKAFQRNVRIQLNEDIYRQVEEEEFSEIRVAIHDTSSHPITAQNFIRT